MRKTGAKLHKKLLSVMKHMNKSEVAVDRSSAESEDYKKLRDLKKEMESYQEDCDVASSGVSDS